MTTDVIKDLKSAMKRHNIKQAALASRLDVSEATISKLLNNKQGITTNIAARLKQAGLGEPKDTLYYQYLKDCTAANKMRVNVKKDCLK